MLILPAAIFAALTLAASVALRLASAACAVVCGRPVRLKQLTCDTPLPMATEA